MAYQLRAIILYYLEFSDIFQLFCFVFVFDIEYVLSLAINK